MFTREVFLSISWSGGSKSGTPKTAFQNYQRILALFIALVRVGHPGMSEIRVTEFIKKKLISNAKSRSKSQGKRVSREKNRSRRTVSKYSDEEGDMRSDNDEDNDGDESLDPNLVVLAGEFDVKPEEVQLLTTQSTNTDGGNVTKSVESPSCDTVVNSHIVEENTPAAEVSTTRVANPLKRKQKSEPKKPAKRKFTTKIGFMKMNEFDTDYGSDIADDSVSALHISWLLYSIRKFLMLSLMFSSLLTGFR